MALHRVRIRQFLAPIEPRWFVVLGIVLAFLGVMLVGREARRGQKHLLASTREVAHTMEIEQLGRTLVAHLTEAEQAVRAYAISGRPEDTLPYQAAVEILPHDLQRLRVAAGPNPAQRPHLDQLELLTRRSLDFLGNVQAARDWGGGESAFALLLTGNATRLLEATRACASLLVLEEQRALAERQAQWSVDAAAGHARLVFVVVVTAVFVAGVLGLARRLAKLHRLARICAWSRTIEYQGEWLKVEDYLERRFHLQTTHGISPAEAEKMRAGMPTT